MIPLRVLSAAILSLLFTGDAGAQVPATLPLPAGIVGPVAPAPAPEDVLGRGTPRGMVQGFLKAVGAENYEKAAAYLDLKTGKQEQDGPTLARGLQTLLDQGGGIEAGSNLSDSPEGLQNDQLSPKMDLVGTVRPGKKPVDLFAERVEEANGAQVWKISKDTVAAIPGLLREMRTGPLDRRLPDILIERKWRGAPVGHWIAIGVIAALSLLFAWMATGLVSRLARKLWPRLKERQGVAFLAALAMPVRIYAALGIFAALAQAAGISIVARQDFMLLAEIAGWLSLWWFLWTVIDIAARKTQDRLTRAERKRALSSVIFFRRSARAVLAAIGIAVAMDKAGMDVTGWFTALGIGGLALAFGAKTTLENFVVGLTMIIDEPFRIGDFCRIGEVKGTVEEIGMRSTRLVTPEKTVVTIPNGSLSTAMIENYSRRDRFWFHPLLALRRDADPLKVETFVGQLKLFLQNHPSVDKDSVQVRVLSIGAQSLDVEVSAYILTPSGDTFLALQGEILLQTLKLAAEAGVPFSHPTVLPAAG